MGGTTEELRIDPEVPEEDATPPRADPREKGLPWDMPILRQAEAARPGGGVWGGESACAKGAVGSSRPGGARSGSAGSPIASGSWTAGGGRNAGGRRRSVNASAGRKRRVGGSTPRRNANGGPRHDNRRKAGRRRPWSRARGHALPSCRKLFASGPAATNHRVTVVTSAIAASPPRGPCVRPKTANASA